ncbi:MAG: hypothetical protein INF91_04740 [Alphaproteobacteria bacterium]|nr:hypothetical protein [Alphaproteobacteria bacterium]
MDEPSPPLTRTGPVAGPEGASLTGLPDPGLAFDYYKSMLSISFATLGGVLTLGETVFGARIAPWQMGCAALPVAISGLLALQGKTDIVQVSQGLKPPVDISRASLRLVPSFYGLGVGLFLAFLLISYLDPELAARLR